MSKAEPKRDDETLLTRIREARTYMEGRSAENRKQGDLDMKCLSVDGPWPEAELAARKNKDNPRPHGHTDITSQYNNRVVNQARMNKRGVKIEPRGPNASKETAEMRENRIRDIQYDSKANHARLSALQNAVDRGYGYWRVDTEYVSPKSRNLKIVVKRIPNPNSVLDDPDCKEIDRSDRKKLIAFDRTPEPDARKQFPLMTDVRSFPDATIAANRGWFDGKLITIAEYWEVEETKERLLFLEEGPEGVCVSELKEGGATIDKDSVSFPSGLTLPILDERETSKKKVMQYFTNGFELLAEPREWPGSTIPFPGAFGREKYEGDDMVLESMTRKAREPQLAFDVARANEMESLNRVSKADFIISDEAIKGYEEMWKMAHRNPQAYLKWKQRNAEGLDNAKPEPFLYEPQIQALEIAANSYMRDIQNAVGMTSADSKDRVSKSGIAQEKMDEAADIAAFHFIDSWVMGIEFEFKIINELLDKIEDSERVVGMRTADGKYKTETISPQEGQPHPYGDGDSHGVMVSTGPDYQSQRQEASAFADTLAANPEIFAILGPLIVNLKELGPPGDKMEKVLLAAMPPQIAAAYADGTEGQPAPLPPEVQQGITQMEEQLKSMDAYAKDAEKQIIELTDKIEGQETQNASKEKIAQADNDVKIKLQQMKDEMDIRKLEFELRMKELEIEVERMRANTMLQKTGAELDTKEALAQHQTDHAETEAARNRRHASDESERGRQHEADTREKQ